MCRLCNYCAAANICATPVRAKNKEARRARARNR